MGNEQKKNGDAGARSALGLIETRGRAPLIEAVDSAIKAANVTLKTSYFVGGGINAVTLVGDVGAMRAALDAARATIERFGVDGKTHLIPRLHPEVWPILEEPFEAPIPVKAAPEKPAPEKAAPVKADPPIDLVPPADTAPVEATPLEAVVPSGSLFGEEVLKEETGDVKEEKPSPQPKKPRKKKS